MLGIPDSVLPHLRRFGFSGVVALGVVIVMALGINPITLLTGQVAEPNPHTTLTALAAIEAGEAEPVELVEAVQREVDGFWQRAFRSAAQFYPPAKLFMASDSSGLGCGLAGSSAGTFYCPDDMTIYVDMAAYAALVAAHPEQGHKAQGYLVGRAWGNHVQHALGELTALDAERASLSEAEAERREQVLGAQAACYGGVWTKAAGLELLLDDPAMAAVIAEADAASAKAALPSRETTLLPLAFSPPSAELAQQWFGAGYAIPAAGSCRLEKIVAD